MHIKSSNDDLYKPMPSTNPADYPNFGMRVPFTLDDLFSDKRFKDIVKAPIEKQAEYADAVCVANAKDVNFCRNQLKGVEEDPQYEKWNPTSIGNCAYMALHGCTETRDAYKDILDKGVTHFAAKFRVTPSPSPSSSSQAQSADSCTIA